MHDFTPYARQPAYARTHVHMCTRVRVRTYAYSHAHVHYTCWPNVKVCSVHDREMILASALKRHLLIHMEMELQDFTNA